MDLLIDPTTGDIWYDLGEVATVDGVDELAQSLRIAFRTGLGEWAFDLTAGMAIRPLTTRKPPDIAAHRADVVRLAMREDGVTGVREIVTTPDYSTRDMTTDVSLDTIYGDTSLALP